MVFAVFLCDGSSFQYTGQSGRQENSLYCFCADESYLCCSSDAGAVLGTQSRVQVHRFLCAGRGIGRTN